MTRAGCSGSFWRRWGRGKTGGNDRRRAAFSRRIVVAGLIVAAALGLCRLYIRPPTVILHAILHAYTLNQLIDVCGPSTGLITWWVNRRDLGVFESIDAGREVAADECRRVTKRRNPPSPMTTVRRWTPLHLRHSVSVQARRRGMRQRRYHLRRASVSQQKRHSRRPPSQTRLAISPPHRSTCSLTPQSTPQSTPTVLLIACSSSRGGQGRE
jgi:hypothetical protein